MNIKIGLVVNCCLGNISHSFHYNYVILYKLISSRVRKVWSFYISHVISYTMCIYTSELLSCLTGMQMLLTERGLTAANQQLHVYVESDVLFFSGSSWFHVWLYQIVLRCAVFLTSCQTVWSLPCSFSLSWFNQWNVSLTKNKLQV